MERFSFNFFAAGTEQQQDIASSTRAAELRGDHQLQEQDDDDLGLGAAASEVFPQAEAPQVHKSLWLCAAWDCNKPQHRAGC